MNAFQTRATFPRRALRLALLLSATACSGIAQALVTVGPDADTACQFHDIQSAVYHAAQAAGPEVVAITSGTWSAQQIDVADAGYLQIEGGFASCSAGISTGSTTLSGAGASPGGPVIRHSGAGELVLRHLQLTQGDAGSEFGGGVSSITTGALTLSDVQVIANKAALGGGIFVGGGGGADKVVRLIGVAVVDNIATGDGGGLYALHASVDIGGSPRADYFIGNRALGQLADSGDGGAILVADSRLVARTHSLGDSGFIEANFAQRSGGGIHLRASDDAYAYLINDIAGAPLRLQYNTAVSGGAASVRASGDAAQAALHLRNVVVEHNEATQGGAAFDVQADSSGSPAEAEVSIDDGYATWGWPGCGPSPECGSVSYNVGHGSADIVRLDGGLGTARARFEMRYGSMRDNFSGGALVFGARADILFDTSVLARNTAGNNLIVDLDGAVDIGRSTIALNTLADQQYVVFGAVADSISLLDSIVFQPAHEVLFALSGVTLDVNGLLTGNLGGLPDPASHNIQFTADARFVDGNAGNLRLRADSPAVDRASLPAGVTLTDRDGATRPHAAGSTTTPLDFGAYEYGAQRDLLFRSGFEPPALPEV